MKSNILASLLAILSALTGIGNPSSLPPGIVNQINGTNNQSNNNTHNNFGAQVSNWAHQDPKPTINGTFGGWVSIHARLFHNGESNNETGNETGNQTGNETGNQTGNVTGNETGNTTANESSNLPKIPGVNLRSGMTMPSLLPTWAVGRSPALDFEPTGTPYPTPPGHNNGNGGNETGNLSFGIRGNNRRP